MRGIRKMNSLSDIVSFKCVLLGDSGSGKTSIVTRYIFDRFDTANVPTIGAAFNRKCIDTGKGKVQLEIWDTAGQERFNSITPMYYKNADIVFVVYDVTEPLSYERAKKWISQLSRDVTNDPVIALIANKIDLCNFNESKYIISKKEVLEQFKNDELMYFETSAKTGHNVESVFTEISKQAMKEYFQNDKHNLKTKVDDGILDLNSNLNTQPISSCFDIISYPFNFNWFSTS